MSDHTTTTQPAPSKPTLVTQITQLLLKHYTAPLVVVFKQFRLGLGLFFCGLVLVYMAHQTMAPSLHQELTVLAGGVVLGIGFVLAMTAQIRMLIIRLVAFFRD